MKYFLREYTDIYCYNFSKDEIEQKELQLKNAYKDYNNYLQKNSKLFQKSFLTELKKEGFHDYIIKNIDFRFENHKDKEIKLNVVVLLESNGVNYYLISEDVKNYSASVNNEMNHSMLLSCYLYGEYYRDEQRLWHHNFLFGDYFEINITSKKFIFKKV